MLQTLWLGSAHRVRIRLRDRRRTADARRMRLGRPRVCSYMGGVRVSDERGLTRSGKCISGIPGWSMSCTIRPATRIRESQDRAVHEIDLTRPSAVRSVFEPRFAAGRVSTRDSPSGDEDHGRHRAKQVHHIQSRRDAVCRGSPRHTRCLGTLGKCTAPASADRWVRRCPGNAAAPRSHRCQSLMHSSSYTAQCPPTGAR